MKVLEKFESAIKALDQSRIGKAKDSLKEGMDVVLHRIKLVRIVDKVRMHGLVTDLLFLEAQHQRQEAEQSVNDSKGS